MKLEGAMRKRIAVLATVISAMAVVVVVQSAPAAAIYGPGPGGSYKVSLSWIQNNIVGYKVGPTRATGYGQSNVARFTKGCLDCTWYKATETFTNHQPSTCTTCAGPVNGTTPNTTTTSGFCWPWDSWPFGGCSGWNSPNSWNWSSIWHSVSNPDPRNWPDWKTLLDDCWQGTDKGVTYGVVGRQAIGVVISKEALIRVSPEGFWYSVIGGCVWQFFN